MKIKKIIFLGFLALTLSAVIAYWALGGFKDPEIRLTESPQYIIIGNEYKGLMTSKDFGDLWKSAEELKTTVKGSVGAVFYNNPQKVKDTVIAFVGVFVSDTNIQAPKGYVRKNVPPSKVVEGIIRSHVMVAPVDIYPAIQDFAKENKIILKNVPSVELYTDKEMIIQVPVLK